jgi:hypothetical protein
MTNPKTNNLKRTATRRGSRRSFAEALVLALPLALAGCTGLEPALVGAAVSGAQTGVTLLSGAEVWSFEIADYDTVVAAVKQTEQDLSLRKLNEVEEADRYWVYYRFARTSKLVIEVRRQTEAITSLEAEVGNKDQHGMASLFMRHVFELVEQTTYGR